MTRDYYLRHRAECIERSRKNALRAKERDPERFRIDGNLRAKRHRDKLPSEERARRAREGNLRKCYGFGIEQYNQLLMIQRGVCAICATTSHGKRLHVDHDHATGKVRGLLCGPCNTALGGFRNNPDHLASAIRYLQRTFAA